MKKVLYTLLFALLAVSFLPALSWPVNGNGKVDTSWREVSGFTAINVNGPATVRLSRSDEWGCSVTIDSNLQKLFRSEVKGETLYLGFKEDTTVLKVTRIEVLITLPALSGVKGSGASKVELQTPFESGEFLIDLEGASSFTGSVTCPVIGIKASGASQAKLGGSGIQLALSLSGASQLSLDLPLVGLSGEVDGASKVSAMGVDLEDLDLDMNGASVVDLGRLGGKVKLDISGASFFTYLGPARIEGDIGSGAFVARRD